jgi:hypothetical protein
MCRKGRLVAVAVAVLAGLTITVAPADADAPTCHKTIVKQLFRFEKVHLRRHSRCLLKDNKNRSDVGLTDQCPDLTTQIKIQDINAKVVEKIADKCTMADIVALGFRADCAYGPSTPGVEGDCAALPVTTPAEFAECLKCWKSADLARAIAILYASHAVEFCGGSVDDTSPVCSALACAAPLPEQRDLGDTGENDCQQGIAKSGIRYLVNRQRLIERCLLKGGTKESCLGDLDLQLKLAKQEERKDTGIKRKCGNRVPSATSNFCCRCGPKGGTCTQVPLTREECLAIDPSCKIQEGKLCSVEGGSCDNAPKEITWWEFCPTDSCTPGTPLADLDDLIACVDAGSEAIVGELLCLQFPDSYPCGTTTPTPTPELPTPTPTP